MWPRIVGSYEISSLLGQGNFGQVRLAKHVVTKTEYAAKIISYNVLNRDSGITDIRREIAILMATSHRNIIHLIDVLTEECHLLVIMELAADGDLFTLINDHGPLPEWKSRIYFRQLIAAVLYCHSNGIYHRDLKPENILLTADSKEIRLADFGFAAVVDKYSSVHRLLHTNCGSPHYCAPEVWNGEHKGYCGRKADAFSCGVILYCMLFGVQPFYDSCEDLVLEKVNKCEFSFPSEISASARDLIEKLLTRDPERRLSLTWAKQHPWIVTDNRSDSNSIEKSTRIFEKSDNMTSLSSAGRARDVSLVSDSSQVDSEISIT